MPATGVATSVTTLWSWQPDDGVQTPGWFFYAPSLENSSELSKYISVKGYLDFDANGKTLDTTTGFWINRVPPVSMHEIR